jgi:hypothetical protein
MEESLLIEKSPPMQYTTEQENRLKRQVQRISISYSVSVTYAIVLSLGALITVVITLLVSQTLNMELRIWMGSIIGVMILALDIMICIYAKDPAFCIHFIAVLMLLTGVAYSLSALHLFLR